jgi:hypothetical protein
MDPNLCVRVYLSFSDEILTDRVSDQVFEAGDCSGKWSISIMFVCFSPVITNTVYSTHYSMYSVMFSKLEFFSSVKASFVSCTQKSPSMPNTLHFQLPVPQLSGVLCMEEVFLQLHYTQFQKTPKGTVLAFCGFDITLSSMYVFLELFRLLSYSIIMLCF